MSRRLKFLDCFQGLGGVSEGFLAEDFTVHGIEINPKIAKICVDSLGKKYPNKITNQVADIRELDGKDFRGYDVIWGSPPCRDFSKISFSLKNKWKVPPDPEGKGMELVNAFLRVVKGAKPSFWVMENSPYLTRYLTAKPQTVTYFSPTMRRALWGHFPAFLISMDMSRGIISSGTNRSTGEPRKITHNYKYSGKIRKYERARIPFPVAVALARACKRKLLESSAVSVPSESTYIS